MAQRVEDALEEVERLGGWRAFLMLPPEAADADAIIEALPWVEQGAPRSGTVVRLFKLQGGLVVVTGGALSPEEGAHLFEIREQLQDVLVRAFIVPPPSAPPPLIARMYETGLAPTLPSGKLPNPRGWAGMATVLVLGTTVVGRALRRSGVREESAAMFFLAMGVMLALAVGCGLLYWNTNRKLQDILSDPVRVVATRWAATLPPLRSR